MYVCIINAAGYRYFKATLFFSGFVFGALVTYVICLEENLLPFEGKVGVAAGAGILCGLITMLVQYVGVFLTGFHLGFLGAVAGLSVAELFVEASSKWTPIGSVFGAGLVCALLALKFQRVASVFATAAVGTAMMTAAVDHFVDDSQLLMYAVHRLKAIRSEDPLCWYGWIVVALGPSAFLVGVIIQFCVTGRGRDHYKGMHVIFVRPYQLQLLILLGGWRSPSMQKLLEQSHSFCLGDPPKISA